MRHEAAMVEHDTHRLYPRRRGETHRESAAVSGEIGGRQRDARGPTIGVRALQVRRRVDLDAELGDVVLARGLAQDGG